MTPKLREFLNAAMHKSQIIPTVDVRVRGLANRKVRAAVEAIRKSQNSTADIRELRSRDHYGRPIVAIAWDDLGNALVLRETGRTEYLCGSEVDGLPGNR